MSGLIVEGFSGAYRIGATYNASLSPSFNISFVTVTELA